MTELTPTDRTRLRRHADRGVFDEEQIHAILDEGIYCHIGVNVHGKPALLPTVHARVGKTLYVHGAATNALLKAGAGTDVCISVAIIDGLVMARSAFNHSVNFRSVVVFGQARRVDDQEEKITALRAIVEHVAKGRWDDCRQPNQKEYDSTIVLALPIEEASAKVRSGPVIDDDEDMDLPYWAGILPLELLAKKPQTDPQLDASIEVPRYLSEYSRT